MGMGYIFLSLSAEEAIRISFRLAPIRTFARACFIRLQADQFKLATTFC
jgi:hypothetical protein